MAEWKIRVQTVLVVQLTIHQVPTKTVKELYMCLICQVRFKLVYVFQHKAVAVKIRQMQPIQPDPAENKRTQMVVIKTEFDANTST